MTLTIDSVSKATHEEWADAFRECEHATFFHSPEWARLWSEASGGRVRPAAKRVTFSDGRRAVLPLSHETRFGGLLSRYVSSVEGTFGGWISREPLALEHASLLVQWLTERQGKSLVWRMNPYDELAFEAGRARGLECRADETHVLDLRLGLDTLFKRFKTRYRSDIRKARDGGKLSVAPARTLEDWHVYYRIYQDSLERWGHGRAEGYPWSLFEAFYFLSSPNVRLWLARLDGEIISGNLCCYAKRHVVYWHGSTLKAHLPTNAAKLVMYEAIKDACERGFTWFDFNPSAGLEGVKFFKEGFNAQPLAAPIVYVDTLVKKAAREAAELLKVSYAKPELVPLASVAPRPARFVSGVVPAPGVSERERELVAVAPSATAG